ncbi:MAG: ribokinase [Lachnospiraceae bacterium]|nr:ribokinase [Lachnospiraceae bacterium]
MKVLCFGSMNVDYVYRVDHVVRLGETEKSTEVSAGFGGKGLNQSVALARAGIDVWHAGMVGVDGESMIGKCRENGVHVEYVRMTEGRCGHTIIQVDGDGNNSILLYGGANQCMTREFVEEVLSGFESGDLILLQNEINLLHVIIDKAFEKGMQVVLNPSPYNETVEECNLSKVSYFLLNEIEGEQMTGKKEPDEILRVMRERYPSAKIVLTLGKDGSLYSDVNGTLRQKAYPVKAVDTTAAGDTFTGYFLYSVATGMTPAEGMKLASMASALTVTSPGAMDSIPTLKEVLEHRWEEEKEC